MFFRGEAILLPPLPVPSLSEREPKDARPERPPHAFRQQPVPGHQELFAEPGGARSQAPTDAPTTITTTTTTVDHLKDQEQDLGEQSGNHTD